MLVTKRLPVSELAKNPAWAKVSPQQMLFLTEYLSNGLAQNNYDAVAACKVAYPRVKATKVWANRAMANKRVRAVLNLHFGFSEAEVLLSDIQRLIKRSLRKGSNLDALVAPWMRAASALESLVKKESNA